MHPRAGTISVRSADRATRPRGCSEDAPKTEKVLLPVVADLHYHGIQALSQIDRSSPELPHYDYVVSTQQVWRDLIGYHTGYGDIRELLDKIDDRYAIVTACDEFTLR